MFPVALILLSEMATSIFLEIDILAIGKLLSMEALGLYSLARSLSSLSILLATKTVRPLVLPTFSYIQDNKESLQKSIIKITKLLCMLGMPFFAFLIIFAKPILSIVYGPIYAAVAIPFSILVIFSMVRILSLIFMQLFFS